MAAASGSIVVAAPILKLAPTNTNAFTHRTSKRRARSHLARPGVFLRSSARRAVKRATCRGALRVLFARRGAFVSSPHSPRRILATPGRRQRRRVRRMRANAPLQVLLHKRGGTGAPRVVSFPFGVGNRFRVGRAVKRATCRGALRVHFARRGAFDFFSTLPTPHPRHTRKKATAPRRPNAGERAPTGASAKLIAGLRPR